MVYYTTWEGETENLVSLEPEPLLQNLKKLYKGTEQEELFKCYSFSQEIKNTFVIKSPLYISASFDKSRGWIIKSVALEQENFNKVLNVTINRDNDKYVQTMPQFFPGNFGNIFYATEDTNMQILNPNYHKTKISHMPVCTGSFNIHRWFRPTSFAVINTKLEDIVFNRGDPLYYVKFHRKENIQLKRFYMTPEIQKIATANTNVKNFLPKTPFTKLYEMFVNSGNQKRIHKEILKQI